MRHIKLTGFFATILLTIVCSPVRAQDTQELFISGTEKYDHYDYSGALADWEKGLKIARQQNDESNISLFIGCIGTVYALLGDYPRALEYNTQVLKLHKEAGDKEAESLDLNFIGSIYLAIGDHPKALDYFSQALKIEKEIGDKKAEGKDLNYIGQVYRNLGDYPKTLDYYSQALKIAKEIGDKKAEENDLIDIGRVYRDLGDYPKALEYYSKAFKIAQEIGDKDGEGNDLRSIGTVYSSLGDYPKALDYYSQALKISKELGNKNHEGYALNNIGVIYKDLGDYPKALEYLSQALKIEKEIGMSANMEEGNIGDIYLAQKKFPEALKIYNRLKPDLRFGLYCLRLGLYYLATSSPEKAKTYFKQSIAQSEQSRTAENLNAGYQGLGAALEQLNDAPASRRAFDRVISVIERQREFLPASARTHFFAAKDYDIPRIAAYEGRCRVADGPADAFYWSENTKARNFIETVAVKSNSGAILPEELDDAETDINNRLAALYKQEETAFQKNNQQRLKELAPEIQKVKREQTDFIAELRTEYPEYAAIQYPKPLRPDEIALDPAETLIEYEVTDRYTKVFLVKSGKVVWNRNIPVTREALNKLVQAYRQPFENRELVLKGGFAPEAGKKLYGLLLKPILELKGRNNDLYIAKGSRLIIVPDEALGMLPFEALPSYMPEKAAMVKKHIAGTGIDWPAPEGVKYVGDDYDIAYAQSATALTLARTLKKREKAAGGLFVLADPVFDRSDSRLGGTGLASYVMPEYLAQVNNSVSKMMGVGGTREQGVTFPRLDQTSELANSLKTIFGTGVNALIGQDASEANLRSRNLSWYKYLVFATHGILDTDIPYIREPALVLNQLGNSGNNDGYLTMSEVMGLKLKADVVALTACKTGMGRQISGEGVMGLGRAFQYAGAKNVLVSLWSVAEQSTTMLVESFFKHLKEGKTPREALKLARSEIRAAGYDHPFFWAPFILMGE